MNNSFTSPHGMPHFSELKKQREKQIPLLINNLRIADVKDDNTFDQTSTRIKDQILFHPVVFEQPQFVNHTYTERTLTFEQQLVGAQKGQYHHEIKVYFTGDKELFNYVPENGYSMSGSDLGIIRPYSNSIILTVSLGELNPSMAISEANSMLGMTKQFIHSNNSSVETWNFLKIQEIDNLLRQKRKELIELFPEN